MHGKFLCIPNLYPCFKVCCPFKSLNQYQFNVQNKKVEVLELVPMDLLNKAKEIAMMNQLVLYNTNPMPLVICVPPPLGEHEQ